MAAIKNCTCIDCMYGGNVGNEHGGIAPPSSEKGDGEMLSADDDIGFIQYYAWAKFSANGSWHVVRVVKDKDRSIGRIETQVVDTAGKVSSVTDCIEISDPIKNPEGGIVI